MKYTQIIDSFKGENRWLSNFWIHDPIKQLSVEHHYQAAKTTNLDDWMLVMSCEKPADTKRLFKSVESGGRALAVRPDWDSIKFTLMEQFVREKFATNHELRQKLIDTRGTLLIEGNTWGDTVWGVCGGVGENNLGKILMKVRDQFL